MKSIVLGGVMENLYEYICAFLGQFANPNGTNYIRAIAPDPE